MEKDKFEIIFNKHSSLTTYYKLAGDNISANAHKVIFSLLAEEQTKLKEQFSQEFKKVIKNIFYHTNDKDLNDIFANIYSKNKMDFSNHKIDKLEILKFINVMVEDKKQYFLTSKEDNKIKATMLKDFMDSFTAKIYSANHNALIEFFDKEKEKYDISEAKTKNKMLPISIENDFDNDHINAIMNEIKEYIQEKVVIEATKYEKRIDLTQLANSLNTRISNLKKEILSASQTFLRFNYLNKKKLNVDVQSSFIASVAFDKQKDFTILEYEIPKKIVNLLLNPEMFVTIDGLTLKRLSDPKAIDLYQFLKDHLLRGYVEVTKEEFFGFIECNKKCQTNKYDLETRVLKPVIEQINLYTDILVEYEFIPEKRWKSIKFKINHNSKAQAKALDTLKIVHVEDRTLLTHKEIPEVMKAIEHAKRNIYVEKAWKNGGTKKVDRMLNSIGKEATIDILNRLYSSLNKPIETTITQYLNGIIKNYEEENNVERKKNTRKAKRKIVEEDKELLEKESKKTKSVKKLSTNKRTNKITSVADMVKDFTLEKNEKNKEEKEDTFDYDSFIRLVDEEKNSTGKIEKVDMGLERYNKLMKRYEELEKDIPVSFLTFKKINFIE